MHVAFAIGAGERVSKHERRAIVNAAVLKMIVVDLSSNVPTDVIEILVR